MRRKVPKRQIMFQRGAAGGGGRMAAPHHHHHIVIVKGGQTKRFLRTRAVVDDEIDFASFQGFEDIEGRINRAEPHAQPGPAAATVAIMRGTSATARQSAQAMENTRVACAGVKAVFAAAIPSNR